MCRTPENLNKKPVTENPRIKYFFWLAFFSIIVLIGIFYTLATSGALDDLGR